MPFTVPCANTVPDAPESACSVLVDPGLTTPSAAHVSMLRLVKAFLSPGSTLNGASGRSIQRYRRAALTGCTSILAKLVVLFTTIVSVPLTYRYLGADRYGLWMTITSFVLFLGFADLGVGNGLAAGISEANGRDDVALAQRQVTCGFFMLLFLGCAIGLLLAAVFPFVRWGSLYGTTSALANHEAGPATAVLILCTALSMPLGTVLRVQLGYQQGYLGDLWNAGGNALALVGIILATHLGGGLPLLVCAVAGAPVLITTANWLVQFFYVRPWLRPRFALFDSTAAMQLAAVGGLFFLQQCFGLIYYVSDNLVIARSMGATEVARYAVLQRIFSIGLVSQYFMVPLWPAMGEAIARQDFGWAYRIVRRAMGLSVGLGAVCAALLLASSRYLMKRWSGIDVGSIDSLRIGFALWVVLVGYIAAMNAILNQPGVMRRHLVLFGSAALASLALKIAFARHGSLAGVVWGTVIGYGVIYVVPAALLAFRSVSINEGVSA
ncbi:MAG TPA: lipopolysaccharide biosynthesis protein [Bryobacteraceae bacterium]|nr:lipopolysaccharide biosynthesis protein [Bryobacteraceae bacterium]